MILTNLKLAMIARGMRKPMCEGFYGMSPMEDGEKAFRLAEKMAAANVGYYNVKLRKAIAADNQDAAREALAGIRAAEAEVEMLQHARNTFPVGYGSY